MFEIAIEVAFSVKSGGGGICVLGRVGKGPVHVGDAVIFKTPSREFRSVISGLEKDRQIVESAKEGDDVGILFRNITQDQLSECLVMDGQHYRVSGLRLISAPGLPKRWWEFWK